jgi:WD40 repeat protein
MKDGDIPMCARQFVVFAFLIAIAAICLLTASASSEMPSKPGREEPTRTDSYGDPLPKGAILRLGTVRFCQPIPFSLAFSPDGKLFSSGGSDNRIRLWDPDTGKELRILKGHKSPVNRIALSADGKLLASCGDDNELLLWDVDTGKVRRRFLGQEHPIRLLALSPNGKVLASSCGGCMQLWDTATGKEIRLQLINKVTRGSSMAFTPDSKHFAFNDRSDNSIQLVDLAEGKVIRTFKGHESDISGLAFNADGTTLVSWGGEDRTIRAWDVATGKEKRRYGDEKQVVLRLVLAPDGKTLTYETQVDCLVHIWDLAANKDLVPPWKPNSWCVTFSYSPDSKKVAMGLDTIAIHETATGKRLNPALGNVSPVQRVEYAGDGMAIAVWRQDNSIELWDTAKWRKTVTLTAKTGGFSSMAFSPRGKYLTTAECDGNQGVLCHWNSQTGQRQKEFPQGKGWLEALSYSADGETLAGIQMRQQREFIRWDAVTGKVLGRITNPDPGGRNCCLSPDGRLLGCWTMGNAVTLWDTKTEKLVRSFGKPPSLPTLQRIAFSPDGRTIATPSGHGVIDRIPFQPDILLWETATGQERLLIAMNEGEMRPFTFSPDGRLLASAGQTETIHMWDAWTGKALGHFTGHRGWINSLSFAPDGKTLVSGGADSIVLIWDVSGLLPAAKSVTEKLSREELAKCWDDLAGTDAARAYQTISKLARCPEQGEGLLKVKLAGNPEISAERLARLIADLDEEDFNTRENATKELANLGRLAEGALSKALEGNPSAEVKQRVQDLLDKLVGKTEDPKQRQMLRSLEVLERLRTPGARGLLDKLAKEATDANVAREAKASLERLGKAERGGP